MTESIDSQVDPEEVDRLVDQRVKSLLSERVQQKVEAIIGTEGADERLTQIDKKIGDLKKYKSDHGTK